MKLSISFKLLFGLSFLIAGMTGSIAYLNSEYLKKTILQRERDFNLSLTEAKAKEVDSYFDKQTVTVTLLARQLLLLQSNPDPATSEIFDKNFNADTDLLSLEVLNANDLEQRAIFKKSSWAFNETSETEILQNKFKSDLIAQLRQNTNRVLTMNSSPLYPAAADQKPQAVMTMVIPYSLLDKKLDQVIVAVLSTAQLQKIFADTKLGSMTIFNEWGYSVASSDEEYLLKTQNISAGEVFNFVKNYPLPNYSGLFDLEGKQQMLSFSKTPRGLFLLSQVPAEVLLAPAQLMVLMTLRLSGCFLAASLFLLFLYSLNLTRPLEKLTSMSLEIAKGNFEQKPLEVIRQVVKDEVHTLSVSVDKMVKGLKERDRFKTLFNKFHGSAVTEDLMKNEIALRGEKKKVFVFFSDVRGFTGMSESRDPAQVVELLNEYFAHMVPVINSAGGVVDKFIGDAIMAVWGVPQAKEDDGKNALMACLKMRLALDDLNQARIARGEPGLWIGMALHYGEAISGTIGSEERMEYTVIGNTVNTASRIEASTKAFGTDLLVSSEVREQLSGFIYSDAGAVEVKGRSEALKLYKVDGFIDENGREVIVKTDFSHYEAEAADKVKVVA